jgi:hypothetical protein
MKQYIIPIICTILLISLVSADIRVTLNTAQVTFKNTTGSEFQYHINLENKNQFPVNVNITLPDDLNIELSGPSQFILSPNETKDIPYKGVMTTLGSYSKSIGIKYEGNNESFSLASTLIFIVTEETTSTETPSSSQTSSSSTESSGGGGGGSVSSLKNKSENINNKSMINQSNETLIVPSENKNITQEIAPVLNKQKGWNIYAIVGIIIIVILVIVYVVYITNKKRS